MRKLTIKSMRLSYFKGAIDQIVDAQGDNLDIYGRNATGKTTVADAFSWNLFGKDTTGRADGNFAIKTIAKTEQPALSDRDDPVLNSILGEGSAFQKSHSVVHGLNHRVDIVFDLDGKELSFGRCYKETYGEVRGSGNTEMTGHTTDFWCNGIQVPKRQYEDTVKQLCDEEVFRSLTDPFFFSSNSAKWGADQRRTILVKIAGEVSDLDILDANPKLASLAGPLADRGIDNHKKWLDERMKAINKEQGGMQSRIDEANRGTKDKPDETEEALKSELLLSEGKIASLRQQKSETSAGGEVARLGVKINEIAGKMIERTNALKREANRAHDDWATRIRFFKGAASQLDENIQSLCRRIGSLDLNIAQKETDIAVLKADRTRKQAEEFKEAEFVPPTVETTCPTCGQALQDVSVNEIIDEARKEFKAKQARLLEEFNSEKAKVLGRINDDGRRIDGEKKALESTKADLVAERDKRTTELEEALSQVVQIEQEEPSVTEVDLVSDNDYQALLQDKSELEAKKLEAANSGDTSDIDRDILKETAECDRVRGLLTKHESAKKAQARVDELQKERKKNASEYEKFAAEMHLCEEFGRAKARALNEKINAKFKFTEWVLFENQQNGGLKEVCYATFKGRPFPDLNNGSQVNIGLDIINTLATYYGFAPPIFIDNAESVNKIIPTLGQQIRLRVTETDDKLRIERASA